MPNELQRRVARFMSGLAEADDFALAGGGMFPAALGQRRPIRDVEFRPTATMGRLIGRSLTRSHGPPHASWGSGVSRWSPRSVAPGSRSADVG